VLVDHNYIPLLTFSFIRLLHTWKPQKKKKNTNGIYLAFFSCGVRKGRRVRARATSLCVYVSEHKSMRDPNGARVPVFFRFSPLALFDLNQYRAISVRRPNTILPTRVAL